MKKFISIILILLLGMTNFTLITSAATAGSSKDIVTKTTINCDLNSASVLLNLKKLDVKTIKFNDQLYFPLTDGCFYFNASYKVLEDKKVINIFPVKDKTLKKMSNGKMTVKKAQNISTFINKYTFMYSGLNEYLDSIVFENTVYVPVRYFSEIFNKKIEAISDGSLIISDIPAIVVGSVDGEKITQQDLDYSYIPQSNNLAQQYTGTQLEQEKLKLKKSIFDSIVNSRIFYKKALENKIEFTPTELVSINNETIGEINNSYGGITTFRKLLADNNTNLHRVLLEMMKGRIINKYKTKLTADIASTEAEMKQYYDRNMSTYTDPLRLKAKHILIMTQDASGKKFTDEKKAEAKAKAEDILTRLKNGEDFDTLMNAYSEDPGLKTNPDGYTFSKGEMVKPFEDAAFSMKVGEISTNLVETDYGYHILKLLEIIPGKQYSYDEVKTYVKQAVDNDKKNKFLNDQLTTWKSKLKIVNLVK